MIYTICIGVLNIFDLFNNLQVFRMINDFCINLHLSDPIVL